MGTSLCRIPPLAIAVMALTLSSTALLRAGSLVAQTTYTVNVTDDLDDGICEATHCSLREAMISAAQDASGCTIAFDIPGSGPHTIRPQTQLPDIQSLLLLDGTTEPDFSGIPVVEIDGSLAGDGVDGLVVAGAGNTIRGLVVNRFSTNGIRMGPDADLNVIEGCFIGTDPDGAAAGNGEAGIFIHGGGSDNTIGGTGSAAGNVLSGNQFGVFIADAASDGNVIEGNLIGTDPTGSFAVPNTQTGILLWGHNTVIGGPEEGAGNLISGNGFAGIDMGGGTSGTVIQGNYIGTDAAGEAAVGNVLGIFVNFAPVNTIGGLEPGSGNVISGNTGAGMQVNGADAHGNLIVGNRVGTNGAGTEPLGNSMGIWVLDAPDNTVGGSVAGAANVISGNTSNGIRIQGVEASGNQILGNFIGTDETGTMDLGNGTAGVAVIQGANNNQVGSTDPAGGNVIAHNGRRGITLTLTAGTGNSFRSNAIYDSEGVGIELGNDGATPNDPDDADTGPNNFQNFPFLLAGGHGNEAVIRATLQSAPNGSYSLDFFSSESCDDSGHGEGASFLGSGTLTTDASGIGTTTAAFSGLSEEVLAATATDSQGSTSEFSACGAVAMLNLTGSPSSRTVTPGQSATFTIMASATGAPFAESVDLACTGNPSGTVCSFDQDEVTLDQGQASADLTVTTVAPAGTLPFSGPEPPTGRSWLSLMWAAALAWILLLGSTPGASRRSWRGSWALPLLLLVPASCGDDGTSGPTGGTPPGSYEITVSGSWESVDFSTTVTLVVQ